MKQSRHFLGALFVFTLAGPTFGADDCWYRHQGNGHFFRVVAVGAAIDWDTAESNAAAAGGYLATITSGDENSFVYQLAYSYASAWGSVALGEYGPWIGGFQPPLSPEPAGGWRWVSSEPFGFTAWNTATEPNNLGGIEDKLHYHARWAPPGTWNDLRTSGEGRVFGYVIERDTQPDGPVCPTVSTWGVVVMALLTLSAGAVVLRGKRTAAAE